MKFNLQTGFFLMGQCFYVSDLRSLTNARPQEFSFLSPGSFMVADFRFRSLSHFELTFEYAAMHGPFFLSFLAHNNQRFQHRLLKRLPFPHRIIFEPSLELVDSTCGLILASLFCSMRLAGHKQCESATLLFFW